MTPEERADNAYWAAISQTGWPRAKFAKAIAYQICAAIAEEREACAKLCDGRAAHWEDPAFIDRVGVEARHLEAKDIAAAIRARP